MDRRAVVIISLLLLPSAPSRAFAASEYFHPKVKAGEVQVRTVMVLPVRAEVTKVGVKGAEPMFEQSDELAASVAAAVKQAFERHGVSLRECPFEATQAVALDPEAMGRLADFDSRFDQVRPFLLKKPKDVQEGRYSLGDEVAELAPDSGADAFVVVRAEAARQTKGLKWLRGDVFNMARLRSTSVEITLVDAHTGEVIGLFQITGGTSVDEAVAKSVAKLPRG